jgi:ATP-binding cassette subfamily B (MDR/TAP) protein 1
VNIQWLREQIGLVSQQPILFLTSIRNNIIMGKPDATEEEIMAAARLANAHDFITAFPEGYDTMVGDQGGQLSGGQRQRIAIARALIKNPSVLLLDEATSALDNESEAIVQDALDVACKARTTIVIAHRLSTIVYADQIVVMQGGRVVETGRHDELIALRGVYFDMVERQNLATTGVLQRRKSSMTMAVNPAEKMKKKNQTAEKIEEEELVAVKNENAVSMFRWILHENKPEWTFLALGIFGSVSVGFVWPVFSVILSQLMDIIINQNNGDDIRNYSLAFVGLGLGMMIVETTRSWSLAVAGERLTLRLRSKAFDKFLSKPVSWFDMPKHGKALLGSRLSNDATDVRGLLSGRLGLLVQLLATALGGLGVALYFCWQIALAVLALVPVIAMGGAFRLKVMTGFSQTTEYEKSSEYASQAVDNIRTVLALGRIKAFYSEYVNALIAPGRSIKKVAWVQGVSFGFSEFCTFAVWSFAFWLGAVLVVKGETTFVDMMKAIMGVLFGAMMSGQLSVSSSAFPTFLVCS